MLASRARFFAPFILAALAGIGAAHGQTVIWNGGTSTDWNTGSNWSTGSVPNSSTTDASLDSNSGNQTVLSSGDLTIGNITIGNTTASGVNTSLTIQSGGELNTNSSFLGLDAGATGAATITGASSTWNTANLTLGGSGSGNLTIASGGLLGINNGNLLLAQNSTATAVLNLNSGGTLELSNTNLVQAGTGNYTFNWAGGTIQVNDSATMAINATLVSGTTSILNDTIGLDVTWSGVISGAGNLTKSGTGVLTLTGNNTYTGATSISAGAIVVSGANAALGGGGSVTLAAGTQLLVSSGNLGGLVNAQGGLTLVANPITALDIYTGGTLQVGGVNGYKVSGTGNYTDNWAGGTVEVVGSDLTGSANATLAANSTSTFNTNGFNATLSGIISGTGNLIVTGNGTLTLSANDIYNGTTTIAGGTLTLNGTSANIGGNITVGAGGAGNLTISGGADFVKSNVLVGNATTDNGTITVTGTNSRWTLGSSASLTVGNFGAGALDVANGGNVTSSSNSASDIGNNAGSVGTVSVTGTGSKLVFTTSASLNIGNLGTGNLTIANGGNVTDPGSIIIGVGAGSNGTLSVNGTSSIFKASSLTVGSAGTGSLLISNGANVSSSNGTVVFGNQAGSNGTVLVTDAGSKLSLGQESLTIGNLGTANVTIANGGNVTSGTSTIGVNAGSVGNVVVTGAGSQWVLSSSSNLLIGSFGAGNLTIANGGNVTISTSPSFNTNTAIGVKAGSSGTLSISGAGSVFNTSSLTVGNLGTGMLLIGSGANVSVGSANNFNSGVVTIGALGNITQTGGNLTIVKTSNANTGLSVAAGGVYNLDGGNLQTASATGAGNLVLGGGTVQTTGSFSGIPAYSLNTTLAAGTTSTINTVGLGSSTTWSGLISGSGSLQVTGNGTLSLGASTFGSPLSANNTYTGATLINNGGTLSITTIANGGVASSIGASTSDASNLVIDNGTLSVGGIGSPFSTAAGTDRLFTIGAGGATIENNGPAFLNFTNSGALAFSAPSGTTSNLTLAGFGFGSFAPTIGDNGPGGVTTVTLNGLGGWTLTGDNTYSGYTNVNDVSLIVNNAAGSGTGSGTVVVNGSSGLWGSLSGNGAISGAVVMNSGSTLNPGYYGAGNLTVGGLTLAANTNLGFQFNSTSNNQVVVTNPNALTINGGDLNLSNASGGVWSALGDYTLIDYSGVIGGLGVGAFSVNNPQPGLAYDFSANGTAVQLGIANVAPTTSWNAAGNGNWNTANNWLTAAVPDGAQSIIGFTNATAPTTVSLDGDHTAGYLLFNSPSGDFTLNSPSDNMLTLDNGAASAHIDVVAGNASISTALTLTGNGFMALVAANSTLALSGNIGETAPTTLTKGGNGILTLSGNNTYTGGTVLNTGTLNINSATALGNGTLTINGGNIGNGSGATVTLANNNAQIWNEGFAYNGPNDLNMGTGNIAMGASLTAGSDGSTLTTFQPITINVTGGNLTVGGAISGNNELIKSGVGTLMLNGNNTYAEGTAVNSGTLVLNGQMAGGATVNNGTLVLDGQVSGGATVNNGTLVLNGQASGGSSSVGNGSSSEATLLIQNGGNDTNAFFTVVGSSIGNNSLLVTGTGSALINTGFLETSGNGSAVLTVANGGLISSAFYWLGLPGFSGSNTNTTINVQSGGTLQLAGAQGISVSSGNLVLNLDGGTFRLAAAVSGISVNATLVNQAVSTIDTGGNNTTWSGVISGTGSLVKAGLGNLTLSGVNTYTGATTITAGTLALSSNNSIASGSSINLAGGNLDISALSGNYAMGANQALTGSGNITGIGNVNNIGTVTINGALRPGGAGTAGILTFNQNLVLGGTATLDMQIGGTTLGSQYSAINFNGGGLGLGGDLMVNLINSFAPNLGDNYDLYENNNALSGVFSSILLPFLISGLDWNLAQLYTTGDLATAAPTTFAAWTADTGLAEGNATANAQPFTDGLPNLLRYAMNLDSTPTPPGLPIIASAKMSGTTYLTISYRQRKNMSDVELVPQYSTDLATWTNVDVGNITQLADDDTYTARAQAQVAIPAGEPVFLRVTAVTLP